ncbi:TetR/AcrR family transcriptional regulator [Mesoterricola silvestris]|uniref:TetR family transcriptional regulator n=1 Tax=Mesoterricola silvestris TaxID=2927979 RepID=A0AA48GTZ3_9BACT|nr:TetR/AcrR family transcriptional regulator [Mesoterricola silvestris]BDU74325.1 TetR family transcriptional regulator [Mesoterricola silvestris]
MARTKAFDRDEALQGALDTFRVKGFEATSIQELVAGMGINRQSIYDTFGDKEALYHAALERYLELNRASMATLLEGPEPLRRALATLFGWAIDHLVAKGGLPCFLAQAALERGADSPASAVCVKAAFGENLRRMETRLRRAQAEGELGPHHDPAALARMFQNTLHGLQVTFRSGASREDLEAIVRVTLSVLG